MEDSLATGVASGALYSEILQYIASGTFCHIFTESHHNDCMCAQGQ